MPEGPVEYESAVFWPIHGGAARTRHAMVLIDLDNAEGVPVMLSGEHAALDALIADGYELAIATRSDESRARMALSRWNRCSRVQMMPVPLGIDRADALARLCRARGIPFRRTIVIATRPYDLPLALEAGTLIALEGAGSACQAAANATTPSRERGGVIYAARLIVGRNRMGSGR